jgi:Ca2+-binding RTX toxin-like protein
MSSYATGSDETLVNTYTIGPQSLPRATALSDGGWVVTWQSYGEDGDGSGIYQQRFHADGSAYGAEALVNTYTTGAQNSASVTALSDGGWLVTWNSDDGNGAGIYQQRYAADGSPTDSETRVNSYTTGGQNYPSVTALSDGGWVVTWQSTDQDGDGYGVYQQRYASDGSPSGAETLVNTYTTGIQGYTAVASLSDGGWVVTWQSYDQDGDSSGIYQQRYTSDGNTSGSETQVNTYTTGSQNSVTVAGLSGGGWVVSWISSDEDGAGYGIYQQHFAANGTPDGAETLVNTYTTGDQDQVSVTALSGGGWVVTWQSADEDGSDKGIYQQRSAADGSTVGTETEVNIYTTGSQSLVSVAALSDGGWVVTWQSYGEDGNGFGVYQRHFAADVSGDSGSNSLSGTSWDETLRGLGGNDTLNGKAGDDILIGGAGSDTYIVNSTGDMVEEASGQGRDTVRSSISYTLTDAVENLILTGHGDLTGNGNALNNAITGNAGKNALTGGAGIDTLTGGKGADSFVFNTGDSGTKVAKADVITDFHHGQGDAIDLHFIDANSQKSGDQTFRFIGAADFDHAAGELRFEKTDDGTNVYGDTNGDGKADFVVHLDSAVKLQADDFVL